MSPSSLVKACGVETTLSNYSATTLSPLKSLSASVTCMKLPTLKFPTGVFTRMEKSESFGLLAPIYQNIDKKLYLFSHHPEGLVWQISQSLTTTPLRAVTDARSCPDSEGLVWEWYNITTKLGQQLYVKDQHVKVRCEDE